MRGLDTVSEALSQVKNNSHEYSKYSHQHFTSEPSKPSPLNLPRAAGKISSACGQNEIQNSQ
jgi:hypothetical protein